MKPENTLILSGGGSKGSFEIGALKALCELGYSYDLVCGTSIGALVGALFAQKGNVEGLEEWIGSFQQNMVATNLFIFPNQYENDKTPIKTINEFLAAYAKGGPSENPLGATLAQQFDFETFKNSPIDFACQSYNVSKGISAWFYKKDMTADNCMDELLSSTAYFPAFNFIQIDGDYYIDGGYYQTIPMDLASSLGADKETVILLDDPKEYPSITQTSKRMVIYPILQLNYYLDFKGEMLKNQVEQGYLETMKELGKAPGYLYTFFASDWRHMKHLEEAVMGILVSTGKIGLLEEMNEVMNEIYAFFLHGYQPPVLKNQYSEEYIAGKLLETLGLMVGMNLYQQYHFKDFLKEILNRLENLNQPVTGQNSQLYQNMELKGCRDYVVFFHTVLEKFGKLPPEFEKLKEKYLLPYYFAYAWLLMKRCEPLLLL